MVFIEEVTKWIENKEKKYEAIEGAKFSLHHILEETIGGTTISSTLEYQMPLGALGKGMHIFLKYYIRKGFDKVLNGLKH